MVKETPAEAALFDLLWLLVALNRLTEEAYKQDPPWSCCSVGWCDAHPAGTVFPSSWDGRWMLSVSGPDPDLPEYDTRAPGYASTIPTDLLALLAEDPEEPYVSQRALAYLGLTAEEALDLASQADIFLGVCP